MPNVKPTHGAESETAIPQNHMVTPAKAEEPDEHESDARGGGSIYTCAFSETETRPQELHSSVKYQEETAMPGRKPDFVAYTELTEARGEVEG